MAAANGPFCVAFFTLCAVLLFSVGNWSLPLIDRDEPRFAEASREMRQSGDYLVPRLNGEYRFDKPPLIYWCQVLSFDGLGENDFAARFPSVIFAALVSVATWMFSSRIFGPRVGIWSGIIFATSLQVFIHARAAVADMPLVFFFLTATWADWERSRNPRSTFWWWIFYLSLGFGFLAKGPAALLPAFFAPARALLNRAPYRVEVRSALWGVFVVLIVIGLWGVPALLATNGTYLRDWPWKTCAPAFAATDGEPWRSGSGRLPSVSAFLSSGQFLQFFSMVSISPGMFQATSQPSRAGRKLSFRADFNCAVGVHVDSNQVASLRPSGLSHASNPGGTTSREKQMAPGHARSSSGSLSPDRPGRISDDRAGISLKTDC